MPLLNCTHREHLQANQVTVMSLGSITNPAPSDALGYAYPA